MKVDPVPPAIAIAVASLPDMRGPGWQRSRDTYYAIMQAQTRLDAAIEGKIDPLEMCLAALDLHLAREGY